MTDLASWLLAQIAEDEAAARAVEPLGETVDMGGNVLPHKFLHSRGTYASEDGYPRRQSDLAAAAHFARHDPARVLAECAAKRRIVELHRHGHVPWRSDSTYDFGCEICHTDQDGDVVGLGYCDTLRLLAQPYAGADGWDEAWKVET